MPHTDFLPKSYDARVAPSTPQSKYLASAALLVCLAASCSKSNPKTLQPGTVDGTSATSTQSAYPGWNTLVYPERHLRIAFPSGWALGEEQGVDEDDGLEFWELQAEDSDTLYYLGVEDMGGVVEPESGGYQPLFNEFVAESLRSFGGELLGMESLAMRGYLGIGYDIAVPTEDPDTDFRLSGRMFLVGSYRLLIFTYSPDAIADETELFLNSLELTPSVDPWAREGYIEAYSEGWADLAMANVAWRDGKTQPSRRAEAISLYAKALSSGEFDGAFAGGIEDRAARILFSMGNENEALAALDRAKDMGYETHASAQIRGLIYFQNKAYAQALDQYERIIVEGEADVTVLYARINAEAGLLGQESQRLHEGQGKRGETDVLRNNLLEHVESAVAFAPDHAGLRVWHAVLRLQNADRRGATLDLRRALANEPEAFEARLNWCWELLASDPKQVTSYASYVEGMAGDDGVLARLAGEMRLLSREFELALPHYERLTDAQEARPELVCKHAGLLNRLHREAEAAGLYARAFRIAPTDESCSNSYAWLLATSVRDEVRDGELAVKLVEGFVYESGRPKADDRLSSAVADTLAAAYAEAERWDEAVATQELAIRIAGEAGFADHSLDRYKERLQAFKAHKPWRERWSEDAE